jgi:hypothetical protein
MVRRRVLGGGLVAVLVLFGVGWGAYAFVLGGGGSFADVAVERVVLNDDFSGEFEAGEGTRSCVGVGPPPDSVVVNVRATVDDGHDPYAASDRYELVVRIGGHAATRTVRVVDGTREEVRRAVTIEDDESVAPGEEATVAIELREGGTTVDSATRTVTVEGADSRCVDPGGQGG